ICFVHTMVSSPGDKSRTTGRPRSADRVRAARTGTPSTSSTDGRVKSGAIAPTSGVLATRNPYHSAETRHPKARAWVNPSSDLEPVAHPGFGQQMLGPGRIRLKLAAELGHVLA